MEKSIQEILTSYFLISYTVEHNYGWKSLHKHNNTLTDSSNGVDECPICFDTLIGKPVYQLQCGHKFDYECIFQTLHFSNSRRCPSCQAPFVSKNNVCTNIDYNICTSTDYTNVLDNYIDVSDITDISEEEWANQLDFLD